ncbi:MAG: TRAP transporter substrate-binding protein DctP [Gammaproteobacteria bacterium]|jgi:TRAP-type C4-dicarboxylate transport system substrate-binding protein
MLVRSIQLLVLIMMMFSPLGVEAATYKIATISPDGLGWMKKLRAGAREIETRTDGRVKFKIYPGGVQGDDATVLRKMRIGQLHGGVVAAGSLTRFYPDLQVYNLPLQFRDTDEVEYVREEMDQMIVDGLGNAGIVSFHLTETGFAYLLSQEPVTAVDDLKDLKAWIPDGDPIAAELVKAFGVSPIPLNMTDVLAGLQTGLIDAVMAPPAVALALQWHNHVKYMTDLPLVYIYSMLAMNDKAYKKIKQDDRSVVQEVMDRVFREVELDTRVDNQKALQALTSIGIETVEVPAEARVEWQAMADQSIGKLIQSGEISPESVQIYLKALKTYREGSASTE